MNIEKEFYFDESIQYRKKSIQRQLKNCLWNPKTKEVLGRDSASWAKLSCFYALFYFWLASFFIIMLAVFMHIMPKDLPTYYGTDGTIGIKGLNPGLGFRPQIDVENGLIFLNITTENEATKNIKNLQNYLDATYANSNRNDLEDIINCDSSINYIELFKKGKSCRFDYVTIFNNTPCTKHNSYGYKSKMPCVLLKLNKLIGFMPESKNQTANSVKIKCFTDHSAERNKDMVGEISKTTYYSENGKSTESGTIDGKYFPFMAQKNYMSPFIWVEFEIPLNKIVHVECKAIADNIEYERTLRRGLTKFTLRIVDK